MRALVAIVIVAAACHGGGADVVPGAPAGDVVEVVGSVKATRAGATRVIGKGDVVSGDDVVATGADGRVTIVLRHNQVPWSLGPNKEKRVADSAAWSAAKGAGPEEVTDDKSTAAGRHAERSATETAASTGSPGAAGTGAPEQGSGSGAPGAPTPVAETEAPAAAAAVAPPPPPPPSPAPPSAQPAEEAAPPARRSAAKPAAPAADDVLAPDLDGAAIGGVGGGGGGAGAPARGGGSVGGTGAIDTGARPVAPSVHGRVTLGSVSSTGPLASADANRAVRAHTGMLHACYAHTLAQNPTLAGLLTITLTVGADGHVTDAKVDASADLGDTPTCVRRVLSTLVLPSASGSSTISARAVLAPQG